MKIKQITTQYRRDFWAMLECEHCGDVATEFKGYDDANFHQNVIPEMKCKHCGKSAPDNYRAMTTKYSADEII